MLPYDLTLSSDAPSGNVISAVTTNSLTLTNPISAPLTTGSVFPIQFTTSGTLPTSTPQLKIGVTYFAYATSATTIQVYTNATDAKFQNPESLVLITASTGSGTNTLITYNTWTFAHTTFKNLPFYDFNGPVTSYDTITFTAGGATGIVTITLSAPYAPLNSSYVGGAFFAGGGTGRIVSVADTSHFDVAVQLPFAGVPCSRKSCIPVMNLVGVMLQSDYSSRNALAIRIEPSSLIRFHYLMASGQVLSMIILTLEI